MFGYFTRRRRRRLRSRPVPPAWREIIARNLPYAAHLAPEERDQLLGHVAVFLHEKEFEGCGGLAMTDEIRVTIAAQACLLLLGRDEPDYYPSLDTVLVYPWAYVGTTRRTLPGGIVVEGEQARLGESWMRGSVVLAWDDVRHSASDVRDGHNVVLHEFAHQLDAEDGSHDGAPVLESSARYTTWARALGEAYARLTESVDRHRRTTIDPYGATSPAEFFAVATETFFEKPRPLRREHPELYAALRDFYRQDPAERTS